MQDNNQVYQPLLVSEETTKDQVQTEPTKYDELLNDQHLKDPPNSTKTDKLTSVCDFIWIFVSSMFITIATVLGISILALPVKTGESGFAPFIVNLVLCLFAQIFGIFFAIEILQRTDVLMKQKYADLGESSSSFISKGPSLYDVGEFYLWGPFRYFFQVLIIVQYTCLLIAYTLAASHSLSELSDVTLNNAVSLPIQAIIPFFVIVLSILSIFGHNIIRGLLSILTGVKVLFLFISVLAVGILSSRTNVMYTDQWKYFGRPFLIGTVTLGNALAALPLLYGKIKPTKPNIHAFRAGSVLGMIFSWVIAVLWTYFILKTIPQYAPGNGPSLQRAESLGQLSTIPLVQIIQKDFSAFSWIGIIITIFIVFSLTVSYIAVSTALKQQVDGYVKAFKREMNNVGSIIHQISNSIPNAAFLLEMAIYLVMFFVVIVISITNSKGLYVVLERFLSFCVNMVSGIFMCAIFFISRRAKFDVKIPVPMLPYISEVFCLVTLSYFSIAVLWDVVTTILGFWIKPLPF